MYAQVHVKLSMLGYSVPSWASDPKKEEFLRGLVREVIDLFGPSRCMCATPSPRPRRRSRTPRPLRRRPIDPALHQVRVEFSHQRRRLRLGRRLVRRLRHGRALQALLELDCRHGR